jgi:hypothetical protein
VVLRKHLNNVVAIPESNPHLPMLKNVTCGQSVKIPNHASTEGMPPGRIKQLSWLA